MTTAQERADEWNRQHPIGTAVHAAPGVKREEGGAVIRSRTRSRAWVVGDTAVVAVKGYPGGISLDHIELE